MLLFQVGAQRLGFSRAGLTIALAAAAANVVSQASNAIAPIAWPAMTMRDGHDQNPRSLHAIHNAKRVPP